jgi:hypothetical protein
MPGGLFIPSGLNSAGLKLSGLDMRHVLATRFLDTMTRPARGGTFAIAAAFLPPSAKKSAIRIGERRPQTEGNGGERLPRRRRRGS